MSRFLSLSTLTIASAVGLGSIFAGFSGGAAAQDGSPRVAEPVVHDNLAVYFLRGTSSPGEVPLTLSEALAKGAVVVHETGRVNELEVENSGSQPVFIQAGDIVKGGQQDRVLTVSLLLSAKSGRLPLGAFCVEQGRWSKRGVEDVKRFASADKAVPSREAKLAMMMPAKPAPTTSTGEPGQASARLMRGLGQSETGSRQSQVWANVGRIQEKLSSNLDSSVTSAQSASSLQLALENDKLATARAAYLTAMTPSALGDDDIIGVAFAINGRIASAEVYPSNGLFRKMWPKLIDASATEAISEKNATVTAVAPAAVAVAAFIKTADQGKAEPDVPLASGFARHAMDGVAALAVATRRADGTEIHRTYLAK